MPLELAVGSFLAAAAALAGFAKWTIYEARNVAAVETRALTTIANTLEGDLKDLRQQVTDDRADLKQELRHIRELLEDLYDRDAK